MMMSFQKATCKQSNAVRKNIGVLPYTGIVPFGEVRVLKFNQPQSRKSLEEQNVYAKPRHIEMTVCNGPAGKLALFDISLSLATKDKQKHTSEEHVNASRGLEMGHSCGWARTSAASGKPFICSKN